MSRYVFEVYAPDPGADPIHTIELDCDGSHGAKQKGRSLCLKHKGPVDIARVGGEAWNDRYLTTVHFVDPLLPWYPRPSTRLERLD